MPEAERLIFALLLSLLLHTLLLFFVRFAPPSWKDFASGTSTLSVMLDTEPAELAKPSAIAAASQDSQATASIGVQDNSQFPEQALAAATRTQVEQARADIPKDFVGKEVMTVTKSAQVNMLESVPDLLVTKTPAPEQPGEKEKPYAPAPSVARQEAIAPPPVERLVSSEPVPGEKQEKIVFAAAAQAEPPPEKKENTTVEPKPAKVEEAIPEKIEATKPIRAKEPEPVVVEKLGPVKVEEPIRAAEPQPVEVTEPPPVKAEEAKPAKVDVAAETRARPAEAARSDIFRHAPPAYKIPSLAELSIASVKKFASDDDRKIKFGERRKTVSVREQDFRYAMYVESVRLKLQRIGMFNYPAAAARDKLSGTLSVVISIRADGSLEEFSVIRPATFEVLNKGAENIVRMSAPFSPLPDSIRQDTDILSIKINWTFSQSSQAFD